MRMRKVNIFQHVYKNEQVENGLLFSFISLLKQILKKYKKVIESRTSRYHIVADKPKQVSFLNIA